MNAIQDFWHWANSTLAPSLRQISIVVNNNQINLCSYLFRATEYYNGDPPSPYERGFISDRVNRLMGFAILRQVRVKASECPGSMHFINFD